MDPGSGAVAYHNYVDLIGQSKTNKPAEKNRSFTLPSVLQRFKNNGSNNEVVNPPVGQSLSISATSDLTIDQVVKATTFDDLTASSTDLTPPQDVKAPTPSNLTTSPSTMTEHSLSSFSGSIKTPTFDNLTASPTTIAEHSAPSISASVSTNSTLQTILETPDNISASSSAAETSGEVTEARDNTNLKSSLMENPTITLTRSYAVMTVDTLYKKYPEAIAELSVLKKQIQQGEIQAIEEIQALHEALHETSFGASVETERLEADNHHLKAENHRLKKRLERSEALLEEYSVYKAHYEESRKLSESYFGGDSEKSKEVNDYGTAVIHQAKKVIIRKNPGSQVNKD